MFRTSTSRLAALRSSAVARDASSSWHYWRLAHPDVFACWVQLRPQSLRDWDADDDPSRRCDLLQWSSLVLPSFARNSPAKFPMAHRNFSSISTPNRFSPTQQSLRHMTTEKSKVNFSTMDNSAPNLPVRNIATAEGRDNKPPDSSEKDKRLTITQKGRELFRKYGVVFVGTYGSIYLLTLFTLFLGVDSGVLSPEQIMSLFEFGKDVAVETADAIGPDGSANALGGAADAYAGEVSNDATDDRRSTVKCLVDFLERWDAMLPYTETLEQNPHVANLAVSWFMVKFTEPIRLGVTVAILPRVARALGRPPIKEEKL